MAPVLCKDLFYCLRYSRTVSFGWVQVFDLEVLTHSSLGYQVILGENMSCRASKHERGQLSVILWPSSKAMLSVEMIKYILCVEDFFFI